VLLRAQRERDGNGHAYASGPVIILQPARIGTEPSPSAKAGVDPLCSVARRCALACNIPVLKQVRPRAEASMPIDMHVHWFPDTLVEALRARTTYPYVDRGDDGRDVLHYPRMSQPIARGYTSLERRCESMDRYGVKVEL